MKKSLLGVDELNNISTDRSSEDSGKSNGGVDLIGIFHGVDRNDGTSSLQIDENSEKSTIRNSLKEILG